MMIKKITLFVILLVISHGILFSQFKYNVEYRTLNGAINEKSQVSKGFGRYNGYTIPLHENETVNFFVYSEDFTPKLVLVDPNGKTAKYTLVDKIYATMQLKIPFEGDWVVYVVTDDTIKGDYYFQYTIAPEAMMYINENADLCEKLDYLVAHSKANFRIFEFDNKALNLLPDMSGFGNSFLDLTTGSYNSTFYDDDNKDRATTSFNNLFDSINKCSIFTGWKKETTDWKITNGVKSKYKMIKEKGGDKRFIMVLLSEYDEENYIHYTVELLVGSQGQ